MKNLTFSYKLILLASTMLILALAASAFNSYLLLKEKTETDLVASIREISSSTSANISDWLNLKSNIVLSMSNSAAKDLTGDALLKVLQQAQRTGNFKNTFVGMQQSKAMFLDDLAVKLPDDYDPTTRPWYSLATRQGKTAFTEPYIDASEGYLVLSVSTPVYQNGAYVGAAGADIQLDDIVNIVNRVDYLNLGHAFLLTQEGTILSHPDKQWASKNVRELLGKSAPLTTSLNEYTINDEAKLVSFMKIDGIESVDWYLGVVLDKNQAYASLSELKWNAFISGLIAVIATIVLINLALKALLRPINLLSVAFKDIAQGEGDLTQRLQVTSKDEFGQLSGYFNQFMDKMHASIKNVNTSSEQLENNIVQVNEVIESSRELFLNQSDRTSSVASAINQLNDASNEISANAQRASNLATEIHKMSDQNKEVLNTNIRNIQKLSDNVQESGMHIQELNANTENIGNILDVIKGVSDQTNLLSLNAAIEAARAGEQGRGFAVVADEVRQLAHRTSDSTNEIQEMIQTLQEGVTSVGQAMTESSSQSDVCVQSAGTAGEKMLSIMESINEIDGENQSVASATEQQSHVIDDINGDIAQLTSLNQRGSENLDRITQECNLLQRQFGELNNLVHQFKV